MDDFQHNVILEHARSGNLPLEELEHYSGYVLYLIAYNIEQSHELTAILGPQISEDIIDSLDISYLESVYMLYHSHAVHISNSMKAKLKNIYG